MKEFWKDLFHFSKSEQRGLVILIVLILGIISYPFIVASLDDNVVDMSAYEDEIIAFEIEKKEVLSHRKTDYRNKSEDNNWRSSSKKKEKKYDNTASSNYVKKQDDCIIEINRTDSASLLVLRGIGPVFAGRIIRYRNLLGGFAHKEQLLSVYKMDTSVFKKIKDNITIDRASIQQININTCSFKEILRHPLIDYQLTKSICNFRKKRGAFSSTDELLEHKLVGKDKFQVMKSYLCVE